MNLTAKHVDLFWSKVSPEPMSGCWLWTASVNHNGYGQWGTKHGMWLAHRLSYLLKHGSVPEFLDHKCRVRSCVNPAHLRPVTTKENVLSGIGPTAVNAKKTRCVRGHNLGPNPRKPGTRLCRECQRMLVDGNYEVNSAQLARIPDTALGRLAKKVLLNALRRTV